jgi:hypothetical protein
MFVVLICILEFMVFICFINTNDNSLAKYQTERFWANKDYCTHKEPGSI